MTCRECRGELIESARGGHLADATRDHVAACDGCRRFLDAQLRLSADARVLAHEPATAPPELEAALLREFDLVMPRTPRSKVRGALMYGAIAASLLAGGFVLRPVSRISKPAETPAAVAAARNSAPAVPPPAVARSRYSRVRPKPAPAVPPARDPAEDDSDQPFLAIPYTAPLAAYERASLVRMDLPVSALIAAGLPVRFSDPRAHASADVMVGEDGRARAVRVISISTSGNDFR